MMAHTDRFRPYVKRYRLAGAVVLSLLALSTTRPTQAQVAHDFRLLPDPRSSASSQRAYFVYEASAGKNIEDRVSVRNESEEPLHLLLFPADAVTASRGGIAIATLVDDTPKRAGAWIDLSQTELTLAPGEDRSVPFTVSLPRDLLPGEYAASIVAQQKAEENDGRSGPLGARFIPRFGVTVLVTLSGSSADALRPHLEITDLKAATGPRQQTVIADLSNSGNDGLDKAEGSLIVRQPGGLLLQEMPVRLGYFLAREDLDYRIGLEQEVAAGEYDVTLALTHRRGTVELTRRLYLGKPPTLPIVRTESLSEPAPEPLRLPRWVVVVIAAAGISIALLVTLLTVQSRRLARAR